MDSWTIRNYLVMEKTFSKILYITYMTTHSTHTHTHRAPNKINGASGKNFEGG